MGKIIMTKKIIHHGLWEKTPWYIRLLGNPAYRRKVAMLDAYDIIDGNNWVWEYGD